MKKILIVLLTAILCVGFVGCGTSIEVPQSSTPSRAISPTPAITPGVTMENYNRIKLGMTYNEVVEIFGSKEDGLIEYPYATPVPYISVHWYNPNFMGTGKFKPVQVYWIQPDGTVTDHKVPGSVQYDFFSYNNWTAVGVELSGMNKDTDTVTRKGISGIGNSEVNSK